MERGTGDKSALDEIRDDFGMKTFSIVNMAEVVGYLYGRKIGGKVLIDDEMKSRIEDYYKIYGAK